jgi:hypothetical protein
MAEEFTKGASELTAEERVCKELVAVAEASLAELESRVPEILASAREAIEDAKREGGFTHEHYSTMADAADLERAILDSNDLGDLSFALSQQFLIIDDTSHFRHQRREEKLAKRGGGDGS